MSFLRCSILAVAVSASLNADAAIPDDNLPADQVFATAKSIRLGATPVVHIATKHALPGARESYQTMAPYTWNHEEGALNCYVKAPATLSSSEAETVFSGPGGEPLNQLSWLRLGEGTTFPSYQWSHEVILNPKVTLVPGTQQLSWKNVHRDCLEEGYLMDTDGNWVWSCKIWSEPRSYTLNLGLRMKLPSEAYDVYAVFCALDTKDESRAITWGEVRSYLKDSLAIEF